MDECVRTYLEDMESEKAVLWSSHKNLALEYMRRRVTELGKKEVKVTHTDWSLGQFEYVSGGIMSSVIPQDSSWFTLTTYGAGSGKVLGQSFMKRASAEERKYGSERKEGRERRKAYKEDIRLLTDTDGALDFFEYCTQMVLRNFQEAGYYEAKTECVKDALCTGVGFLAVEEDIGKSKVWYQCLSPLECCWRPSRDGRVDSFGRRWKMTAYDIVRHFEGKRIPDEVMKCIREGNAGRIFEVCEVIVPRGVLFGSDMRKVEFGKPSDPYMFAIWLSEGNEYIQTGSMERMPVTCMVYEHDGRNQYGRGMVENAINSIVDLDELEKERQVIRGRTAFPPVAVHPSYARNVNLSRNAVNVIPDMANVPVPIQFPDTYTEYANDVEMKKQEVRQLLFVDVFQTLLASNDSRRTATEVTMRKSESAQLMQQAIGNMERVTCTEVMQTLALLMRQGKIAKPSDEVLALVPYVTMVFSSSFIQMKNSYWMAEGNVAFLNYIVQLAGVFPDILDIVDMDVETQMIAVAYGQSQYAIREKSEVEQIRKNKAEMAQAQLQMQQEQQASEINRNNAQAQAQMQMQANGGRLA